MENESDDMLYNSGVGFPGLFDKLQEGVQVHDFDWRYLYVNDTLVKYSSYSKEDLIGHTLLEKYPDIQETPLFNVLRRCMNERTAEYLETEFIFPDGKKTFFELNIQPIPEGLLIISENRSEREKSDEKLLLVNRLLAFISQVNQCIVHINDQESLFQSACSIAIQHGEFKMAWIGLFDEERKRITLTHQCGVPEADHHLFINASFQANGPQEYVLKTGTTYICNDLETNLELEDWKPYALKHGIRSCIVLPLRKSGQIIGTFNLYTTKKGFEDQKEIRLLEQVAVDISFALDNYERAKKQKEAEEQVILNERRFRALIEKDVDMKTLSTVDGQVIYCSPSIIKIFGYSRHELIDDKFPVILHPDDARGYGVKRGKILKIPGASFHCLLRFRHKNGNWIWCEGTVTNLLEEPGVNGLVSNFRDVTERKVNEFEREFAEKNLFALINNTHDLMWSIDKEYKLITFNKPFYEVLKQVTGKELKKGDDIFSVVLSDDQLARFHVSYNRAFAGETFTEIEHIEGPFESWSEISYYPIRNGNEVIGTACHSRDISRRKKAEEKLHQSETFNRGVLNSLSSHIAVIEASGKIIAVNESWKRFAIENGETLLHRTGVGSNYYEVCERSIKNNETIADEALLGIKDVMKEKKAFFYLEYPCHSPGEQRWFGMLVRRFDSVEPMVVIAHQDISERKLAERKLIQSESRLKEAQALAHISNWEINLVQHVHTWSDELYKIFLVGKDDIEPSTEAFLSFMHPDDAIIVRNNVEHSFKTLRDSSYHFRFRRRDGIVRYGYVERKFEFDENNKPIRVYGTMQDVTERRMAQEKLEEQNSELIKINLELDRFVYSVSHDLRSPLTSMLGLVTFIEEDSLEPDTLEHAGMIRTSINRLDGFIKNILSYSQNNRTEVEPERIHLQNTVGGIIESLRSMEDANGIHFEVIIKENAPFYSDRQRFTTAIENLVSNAIKYHSKEPVGRYVRITGTSTADDLELTVSDNGIGIAPADQDRIFDMFIRLSGEVTGSGIGLYLVREVVEKLQGTIRVSSEEGKGASFIIRIKNLGDDRKDTV